MSRSCDAFKITILKASLLKPTSLLFVSVVVSTGLTLPIVASMSLYFHGVVKYDCYAKIQPFLNFLTTLLGSALTRVPVAPLAMVH